MASSSIYQCQWMVLIIVFATICARNAVSVNMDFIKDCCSKKCGTMNSPLWLASGLDKTNGSWETLYIATTGNKTDLEALKNRADDDLCLISVYTNASSATMNFSFYLSGDVDPAAVIVVDSQTIPSTSIETINDDGDRPAAQLLRRREVLHNFGDDAIRLLDGKPHKKRSEVSSVSLAKKHYRVESYRIRSGHRIIIAAFVKHIRSDDVHIVFASFAADKGTSGVTFFIILGVVFALFLIGVPASLMLYRRYRKNKKKRQAIAAAAAALLPPVHYSATGDPGSPVAQVGWKPKMAFRDRVRDLKEKTGRRLSLPVHDLLKKQETRKKSLRPISKPSETSRVEFAFPGMDPGREDKEPPTTMTRPRSQGSRTRVVSHLMLRVRKTSSTEDLYSDIADSPS